VLAEGMVYDEFDQKIHVIDPIDLPMNWKYYRSIDWGYQNPFCCLFAAYNYKDNILYIYDEHYKAKKLIEYHAEQIKKRDNRKIENKEERIYFDKTFADHDAQDNAEIKKYGIHTSNAVKGEVNSGIQRVKARLKVIDGKPKLYVFKNCENLIREFGLYRWNDKREGYNEKEEPVKAEDHALDPLRYLINYLDKGKLKVSKVSASSLGL
jgi:phage terminase large subunit